MKLLEIVLVALFGASIVIGAYIAGKNVERTWWRQELASRNSEVAATLSKLGTEATDLDAQLLKALEANRANLATAESDVSKVNAKQPDSIPAADNPCRPVPAHCLLRRPDNRPQAHSAAASGAGSGR